MPSRNSSRLDSALIARKGEAAPAAVAVKVSAAASSAVPHGTQDTIAISVRLDAARYERLKMHGVRRRLTNQEIMVTALDAYLANNHA